MAVYLMTYHCTSPAICAIPKGERDMEKGVSLSLSLYESLSLSSQPEAITQSHNRGMSYRYIHLCNILSTFQHTGCSENKQIDFMTWARYFQCCPLKVTNK